MSEPTETSEPIGARPCPSCGAVVGSQYCPHCGARVLSVGQPSVGQPSASSRPVWTGSSAQPEGEAPTIPSIPVIRLAEGPAAAVPEMFPTEMVPTSSPAAGQAWSETADPAAGPPTGLFPGWTGMYPAVATDGAGGVHAPRRERRRRALYAVLGIAAVTVLVLLAALLIAPHLGGTSGDTAGKDGQPTAVSRGPVTSSSASGPSGPSTTPSSAPVAPPVSTVTVTASVTSATVTPTRATSSPSTKSTPTMSTPTPKPSASKNTTPALPLGVPQKNIVCSAGYVVQLASELNMAAFTARVAALKAAGQVPPGSLAADSAKSCKIFTSQSNTLVLYSGPYGGMYDGCAARLAGPADAYIKGSNPATSEQYISCLCPVAATRVPDYSKVGEQGVWIGEMQRVLGNRLNIDIPDLAGHWGTYTAGTRDAVTRFQRIAHLPADGVVNARTWQALQGASC